MPNWCENEIVIESCDIEKFKADCYIDKGEVKTHSSKVVLDRGFDNVNWYKDNVSDLGVKWHFDLNINVNSIEELTEDIIIWCNTAWSYPQEFIVEFAKAYNITGRWAYSEGGVGFAGEFIIDNGDILDHNQFEYKDERNTLKWEDTYEEGREAEINRLIEEIKLKILLDGENNIDYYNSKTQQTESLYGQVLITLEEMLENENHEAFALVNLAEDCEEWETTDFYDYIAAFFAKNPEYTLVEDLKNEVIENLIIEAKDKIINDQENDEFFYNLEEQKVMSMYGRVVEILEDMLAEDMLGYFADSSLEEIQEMSVGGLLEQACEYYDDTEFKPIAYNELYLYEVEEIEENTR